MTIVCVSVKCETERVRGVTYVPLKDVYKKKKTPREKDESTVAIRGICLSLGLLSGTKLHKNLLCPC